jgi:hypothetical protein
MKALGKVAHLRAELGAYDRAAESFETVGWLEGWRVRSVSWSCVHERLLACVLQIRCCALVPRSTFSRRLFARSLRRCVCVMVYVCDGVCDGVCVCVCVMVCVCEGSE